MWRLPSCKVSNTTCRPRVTRGHEINSSLKHDRSVKRKILNQRQQQKVLSQPPGNEYDHNRWRRRRKDNSTQANNNYIAPFAQIIWLSCLYLLLPTEITTFERACTLLRYGNPPPGNHGLPASPAFLCVPATIKSQCSNISSTLHPCNYLESYQSWNEQRESRSQVSVL